MEKSKIIINISDLPEFARTELLDFYEFLKMRHKGGTKKVFDGKHNVLSRFVSNPIKVDRRKKYARDELHAR